MSDFDEKLPQDDADGGLDSLSLDELLRSAKEELARADRLIDEPANTIAEIAFKCGFNNLSNFNRIFKKYKGYTPHDFREYYDKKKIII